MKHLLIPVAILVLLIGCSRQANQNQQQGAEQESEFDQLLARAQNDTKPILINFFTEW